MAAEELEWNAASHRVLYISKLRTMLRHAFAETKAEKTADNVRRYMNLCSVLFEEIQQYLDDDRRQELIETVEQLERDVQHSDETAVAKFHDIRELDRELAQKCHDINLDIPSSTETDFEEAFGGGDL